MSLENTIRAIAGSFILISLALGYFVSPYWFLFTTFVGVNLFQSAFTKWCLMEDILKKTCIKIGSIPPLRNKRICGLNSVYRSGLQEERNHEFARKNG